LLEEASRVELGLRLKGQETHRAGFLLCCSRADGRQVEKRGKSPLVNPDPCRK
jgi:hypothetical protein